MKLPPNKRYLVHIAGLALLGASLWFLGQEFAKNWSNIDNWRPSQADLAVLATLSLFYGGSLFILAEGWHRIIDGFGNEPRRRTYLSFTSSQIARYIPGNVAHLLGRAIWLRGGALSDGALARATAIEISVTPVGAICALILLGPVLLTQRLEFTTATSIGAAVLLAGMMYLLFKSLMRLGGRVEYWMRRLWAPVVLSTVFLLLFGLIFATLCTLVGDQPVIFAVAAAIAAWIAGYITPGAPGGLGVREAVLVALLSGSAPMETILLASVLFRIVTTIGEVSCFLAGVLAARCIGRCRA